MVLPPLELFSLRKELPCCRAALSVFMGNVRARFRSQETELAEVCGLPPLAQKIERSRSFNFLRFAQDDHGEDGTPGLFLPL
jgi:hypothetical protein